MFEALRTAARMLNAALVSAAEPRSQRLLEASIDLRDVVEDISGSLEMADFERQGIVKGLAEFDRVLLHAPVMPMAPHGSNRSHESDAEDRIVAASGAA
ncbi:MAG: hypothetical protein EON93_16830 [Burkholderiales bacterium]|nr:MAG: hypothetical protein EON93_16830 [Burkholderiales bacterium]